MLAFCGLAASKVVDDVTPADVATAASATVVAVATLRAQRRVIRRAADRRRTLDKN